MDGCTDVGIAGTVSCSEQGKGSAGLGGTYEKLVDDGRRDYSDRIGVQLIPGTTE